MWLTRIISFILQIFPLNSSIEIFLRTLYHHLTATKLYLWYQIKESRRSYPDWLKLQNDALSISHVLNDGPRVTFIIPIYSSNESLLQKTFQSIVNQYSTEWDILFTGCDEKLPKVLSRIIDKKKFNIRYCAQSTPDLGALISRCTTKYAICCAIGDSFSPFFLDVFGRIYSESPGAAIYYTDVDIYEENTLKVNPFFKPSQFSPELLLSTNYLTRSIININYAKNKCDKVDASLEFFDQEWNLLLLISQKSRQFLHLPTVLIHILEINHPRVEETKNKFFTLFSKSKYLGNTADANNKDLLAEHSPKVSIIIPTKNKFDIISTMLDSIYSSTNYSNYEVILVDNGSDDSAVLEYYAKLGQRNNFCIVNFDEMFNYSRAINIGACAANGELLLFLNNDMQVINPTWLTELVKWAMIPEVGVVGTKLLRANHQIQHAGMVLGLQGSVGHIYLNAPDHYFGLNGSVDWTRNVSAVTGACQMIRREVFFELGGYDENFELIYSDVDFCLRGIENGYRVVYAPSAALFHYEGKSRGFRTPINDISLGFKNMRVWLEKDDPYFSPNLTYALIPRCQMDGNANDSRLENIQNRQLSLERKPTSSNNRL
jgi:O-antigen biosynthesis protein